MLPPGFQVPHRSSTGVVARSWVDPVQHGAGAPVGLELPETDWRDVPSGMVSQLASQIRDLSDSVDRRIREVREEVMKELRRDTRVELGMDRVERSQSEIQWVAQQTADKVSDLDSSVSEMQGLLRESVDRFDSKIRELEESILDRFERDAAEAQGSQTALENRLEQQLIDLRESNEQRERLDMALVEQRLTATRHDLGTWIESVERGTSSAESRMEKAVKDVDEVLTSVLNSRTQQLQHQLDSTMTQLDRRIQDILHDDRVPGLVEQRLQEFTGQLGDAVWSRVSAADDILQQQITEIKIVIEDREQADRDRWETLSSEMASAVGDRLSQESAVLSSQLDQLRRAVVDREEYRASKAKRDDRLQALEQSVLDVKAQLGDARQQVTKTDKLAQHFKSVLQQEQTAAQQRARDMDAGLQRTVAGLKRDVNTELGALEQRVANQLRERGQELDGALQLLSDEIRNVVDRKLDTALHSLSVRMKDSEQYVMKQMHAGDSDLAVKIQSNVLALIDDLRGAADSRSGRTLPRTGTTDGPEAKGKSSSAAALRGPVIARGL